jgi:hypothetical protein
MEKVAAKLFRNVKFCPSGGHACYDFSCDEGLVEVKSCQLRTRNSRGTTQNGRFSFLPESHRRLNIKARAMFKAPLYHLVLYSGRLNIHFQLTLPWKDVDSFLKGNSIHRRQDGTGVITIYYAEIFGFSMNFAFEGLKCPFNSIIMREQM